MSHAECQELLAIYRDLDAVEQARVDEHLEDCPACAARLLAYRTMDRDLATLPDDQPSDRLDARFAAAVAAQRRPGAALWRRAERVGNALAWTAVGMIAALLLLGLVLAARPLAQRTWPAGAPTPVPTVAPTPGLGRMMIVRDELITTFPFATLPEGGGTDQASQLSPDGRRVAYFVPDGEPGGINLVAVRDLTTGQEWRGLVNGCLHTSARWSPDSRSLAVVASRPGTGGKVTSELWRVDLDGQGPGGLGGLWTDLTQRLSSRAEADRPGLRLLYGGDGRLTSSMGPAIVVERWSADGRYVELGPNAGSGEASHRRVRADGGGSEIIAEPSVAEFGVDGHWIFNQPVPAPTGDYWLAVVNTSSLRQKPEGAPASGQSLVRYDVKAREAHVLAALPGEIYPLDMRFSPDGEWITFLRAESSASPRQPCVIRRDGTGFFSLALSANGSSFAWGAPGRVYAPTLPPTTGAWSLYEVDLATGEGRPVAGTWPPAQAILAASRDGRRLLVSRSLGEVTELRWLEVAPLPEPTPRPQPTRALLPSATGAVRPAAGPTPDVWCPPSFVPVTSDWPPAVLGCPMEQFAEVTGTSERFEHGRMFQRPDTRQVYALWEDAQGTHWRVFPDPWQEGEPLYDERLLPPAGRCQPGWGMGKVWRKQLEGSQGPLGWGTEGYEITVMQWQTLGRAVAMVERDANRRAYALFPDGHWERSD